MSPCVHVGKPVAAPKAASNGVPEETVNPLADVSWCWTSCRDCGRQVLFVHDVNLFIFILT